MSLISMYIVTCNTISQNNANVHPYLFDKFENYGELLNNMYKYMLETFSNSKYYVNAKKLVNNDSCYTNGELVIMLEYIYNKLKTTDVIHIVIVNIVNPDTFDHSTLELQLVGNENKNKLVLG